MSEATEPHRCPNCRRELWRSDEKRDICIKCMDALYPCPDPKQHERRGRGRPKEV